MSDQTSLFRIILQVDDQTKPKTSTADCSEIVGGEFHVVRAITSIAVL
jgi:hypothetical protein